MLFAAYSLRSQIARMSVILSIEAGGA